MNGKKIIVMCALAAFIGFGLAACANSSPAPVPTADHQSTSSRPPGTSATIPTIHVGQSGSFILDQPQLTGGSNNVTLTLNQVATAHSATYGGTTYYPGPGNYGAGTPNPAYQWVAIDVTIKNNGMNTTDPGSGVQPVNPDSAIFQWVALPSHTASSFTTADIPGDANIAMAIGIRTQTDLSYTLTQLASGQQVSGEYTFSTPAGRGNLEIINLRGQPVAILAVK